MVRGMGAGFNPPAPQAPGKMAGMTPASGSGTGGINLKRPSTAQKKSIGVTTTKSVIKKSIGATMKVRKSGGSIEPGNQGQFRSRKV